MSPQVRLPFIPGGFLNSANSPVVTGQYEPITGLPLPSGASAGMWFDMTEGEAQAYSNGGTGLQLLHAGRYQWVQLSSSALASGTGSLKLGQGLFWVPSSNTPQQYVVTNVPVNSTSAPPAGVFLNTATAGAYPVTPGNWFFMQSFAAPGRATVQLVSAITNGSPAIGDTIVLALEAAGAANTGLFDDPGDSADATAAQLVSVIGSAETAPASGGLVVVDIRAQIGG